MVAKRNKDYGNSNPYTRKATNQPNSSPSSISNPASNVVPTELIIKPPKGIIHKSTFNPRSIVAKNYNIV